MGLGNLDVRADNPQTYGTTCCANQQQVTATDVINQPKQPNESHYGLDYTENSSGEQTGVGTPDTNLKALLASVMNAHMDRNKIATYRFEDSRTVIIDGIDTRSILPEEQRASEE